MSRALTFSDVVMECFGNEDLMREYRRLTGDAMGQDRRDVATRMIDAATGHVPAVLDEAEALRFIAFVKDVVWDRLPASAFVVAP